MFVYWANEAKNPFFEANNFKLWVSSHSRKKVNAKIIIHNKPIGEIYKDDNFTEMDYSGFHKSFRNENLDFYVSSQSKVPLFFVIGNCLFIQKGMNNIIKNFSIFYDDGLRIFEDIRFVNFEVAYF